MGLDHQGLTLPAAAGAPRPLRQLTVGPTVERDDAGVVHHLVQNRDIPRSLHDQHIVVVGARRHGRSGVEPHQAPVGQTAVRVVVREAVAQVQPLHAPRLGGLSLPRDTSLGGVDDQRRAVVGGQLDPALVPELVVGQHAALGPRLIAGTGGPRLRVEQIAVQTTALGGLELGSLLGRQLVQSLQRARALQGRQGPEREDPGDVRVTVGRFAVGWPPYPGPTGPEREHQQHTGQRGRRTSPESIDGAYYSSSFLSDPVSRTERSYPRGAGGSTGDGQGRLHPRPRPAERPVDGGRSRPPDTARRDRSEDGGA